MGFEESVTLSNRNSTNLKLIGEKKAPIHSNCFDRECFAFNFHLSIEENINYQ